MVRGKFFNKDIAKVLFKYIQRVIFISEAEYESAKERFQTSRTYFFIIHLGWLKFWNKTLIDKNDENDFILFIGNDLNRDYEFLLELIEEMPDLRFKIISNRIVKNDFDFKNAELINGDHSEEITDSKIREYYGSAFLTIIPLKIHSTSGQSVCLHSILCETPVLISETEGFESK